LVMPWSSMRGFRVSSLMIGNLLTGSVVQAVALGVLGLRI
jgi:hypothetical protein